MKSSFPRLTSVIGIALSTLLLTGMDSFASSSATSISEAAPLDVVLVIDASESMTFDAALHDPMRDPAQCNPAHKCHPIEEVKDAAKSLVDRLNFPYDRVAIVTFDDSAHVAFSFADFDAEPDGSKKAAVLAAIESLGVVSPDICDWTVSPIPPGPCREYARYADSDPIHGNHNGNPYDEPIIDEDGDGFGDTYLGFDCPVYRTGNPSTCGTTAIGQGLLFTGNEFDNPLTFREGSLPVAILLSDGAANAPSFVCPHSTWISPFCRDLYLTRHCLHEDDTSCLAAGGVYQPELYDADDYARDMVDFVSEDQDALIYTIGLGDLVRTSVPRARISDPTQKCSESPPDPIEDCYGAGEQLLRYAAGMGGGKYYYTPSGDQLDEIFVGISSDLPPGPKILIVTKTADTNDGICGNDCSLREAITTAVSGSTINFDSSLTGQTIALSSTLTIDKNLIIDGSNQNSHVQVSGDTDNNGTGDVSVFQIVAGNTVEINGLDIVNGHHTVPLNGGGVNNDGNLTITNCSFSGNSGDEGGAIHSKGSLTVSSCSFTDNMAEEGGAIFNDIDGIAVISKSAFTDNTGVGQMVGSAGAIANIGTLTVSESDFIDNTAEYGGGAIVNSFQGMATVQGSTFTGNTVTGSTFTGGDSIPGIGGAIDNHSGTLTVRDSTFSNNSAEYGAAINVANFPTPDEDSNISIENSTFSGNTAYSGGGLHVFSGTVTVSNSTFNHNSADGGGGIANLGTLTLTSSTLVGNSSIDAGGIFNEGDLSVENSTFTQNVAAIPAGSDWDGAGGAIVNFKTASIVGSTFSENSAEGGGGALVNTDVGVLNVTGSTFTGNWTAGNGGGINNYAGTLTVIETTFSGNSAEMGAAIHAGNLDPYFMGSNVTIKNSTFKGNSAESGGGVVNIAGTVQITNSTFNNNSSTLEPMGGIYNGGSMTIKNTTVSEHDGGLYNASGGSLNLQNTILANSAIGYDCYNEGTLTSETHNLIEVNGSGDFACGTPVSTADPLLGPLADNGGANQTMALLNGSPAIDKGDGDTCEATDQRGVSRPQGAHCDVGAYEYQDPTLPAVVSITLNDSNPTSASSVDFTVRFSEAITGVDTSAHFSDFALTTTGAISGAEVKAVVDTGDHTSYTVTVNTGIGNGTLRLDVVDNDSILDSFGNLLGGPGAGNGNFTAGEGYTVIKTATFGDAPTSHWAWKYIESIYLAGITGGCGTSPLIYCPESTVTRAQMAVFLERGIQGSGYSAPVVPISFTDTGGHWAQYWIEALKSGGITGGCGVGVYCPENPVTRAQMAVFLLKSKHGASYLPPAIGGSTGFNDVPLTHWAAAWIKQLAAEGITGGCGSNIYCPEDPVTRAQMAVFLQRTFNLPVP